MKSSIRLLGMWLISGRCVLVLAYSRMVGHHLLPAIEAVSIIGKSTFSLLTGVST